MLGYGTQKGGKIYIQDDDGRYAMTYYNENFDEVEAVSKLNETNLKKIASDMGISDIHMEKGNEADGIVNGILKSSGEDNVTQDASNTKSTGAYFAIVLILLMIYEFFSMHIRHNEKI